MRITFVQTGGTIDKDYPKNKGGYAFEFGEPAVNRILERLNPSFDYKVVTVFQKDSLEITSQDREKLMKLLNDMGDNKIIITHGTDTMIETGKYLYENIKNKVIVLTGAMRPERFINSDAAINLGCAIATVNLCDRGVFIAMHGIIKPVNLMNRHSETGKYY